MRASGKQKYTSAGLFLHYPHQFDLHPVNAHRAAFLVQHHWDLPTGTPVPLLDRRILLVLLSIRFPL